MRRFSLVLRVVLISAVLTTVGNLYPSAKAKWGRGALPGCGWNCPAPEDVCQAMVDHGGYLAWKDLWPVGDGSANDFGPEYICDILHDLGGWQTWDVHEICGSETYDIRPLDGCSPDLTEKSSCSAEAAVDDDTGNMSTAPEDTGKESTWFSNPCNVANGNKYEREVDYASGGSDRLEFVRFYNSRARRRSSLGFGWQSNFDARIYFVDATTTKAQRPDGSVMTFLESGGTWAPDSSLYPEQLTQGASDWTLTTRCIAPGSLDTSLSHAAGLSDIAGSHA